MSEMNRRTFLKNSLLAPAGAAIAAQLGARGATGAEAPAQSPAAAPAGAPAAPAADALPCGKIGELKISRILLGGNLLTHYTHSRDLQYVYNLCAHYNTEAKILETLAKAEEHGVNTLAVHTVPECLKILQKHRKAGGKMQWIICPTANIAKDMQDYKKQVEQLAGDGTDAIYLWGVRADALATSGQVDLITKCVECAKAHAVPSGVGAHDIRVIEACETAKVPCDFYIKTFHHHRYPSAPRPDQVTGPICEVPGYWCKDPQATIDLMKTVEKPWIAFKIMAAGAIPPSDALPYVFNSGADHALVGMFDFEIAQDAAIARKALAAVKRDRPWRS
jgi:hypothetical protein